MAATGDRYRALFEGTREEPAEHQMVVSLFCTGRRLAVSAC
jgi:hypothetical protein